MTTNHHKHKLLFLLLALLLLPATLQAQELSVKSFSEKNNDLSASTQPRLDNNGTPCALVKVQIAAQGVRFEGSVMGNVIEKTSEYWVYMPKGSKRLKVFLSGHLPVEVEFSNYSINSLESKRTYLLIISGVSTKNENTIRRRHFDWGKDFRCILGLNNGIVSSEIIGFYGEIGVGEHYGLGFVGGYCPGFSDKYGERWSIGLKCYLKSISLSAHYGTLLNIYATSDNAFSIDEDGTFHNPYIGSVYGKYGISALLGYNHCFGCLHLTVGMGITVPQNAPKNILFSWNLGLGFSFVDFLKNR